MSEFTTLDAEQAVCKATIADKVVIAVGHAHEERSPYNINKTSYVENCETSAIGRALAMLGIGIDTLLRQLKSRCNLKAGKGPVAR